MKRASIADWLRSLRPSTADTTAAARAMHQREPVRILEDPCARALSGWFWNLTFRCRPLEWFVLKRIAPIVPTSMCVLMRARYAEQALEKAVDDGVTQYVVIGAGMDSFAFRRPDLMNRIDVFEIDHPVTQRQKLARIRRAGWPLPDRLHFVAADLATVSAIDALDGTGFDHSRPTFLTLLGVTYYVTADDLAATARSISRSLPVGTRFGIDYLLDEASSDPAHLPMRSLMKAFVARRGEPIVSEYSPAAMEALMTAQGFDVLEHLTLPDLESRYREELGAMPHEVPHLFGVGLFEVAGHRA